MSVNNVYHLHAILVHRGGVAGGHYFAYIRPDINNQWYEFNDSVVKPILTTTAFSVGFGGSIGNFEVKDGRIDIKQRFTDTSAYMLVYIREGDRDSIMSEVDMEDIPSVLKERFDEENMIN